MEKRFDDVQSSNKRNLRQYNFEHIRCLIIFSVRDSVGT